MWIMHTKTINPDRSGIGNNGLTIALIANYDKCQEYLRNYDHDRRRKYVYCSRFQDKTLIIVKHSWWRKQLWLSTSSQIPRTEIIIDLNFKNSNPILFTHRNMIICWRLPWNVPKNTEEQRNMVLQNSGNLLVAQNLLVALTIISQKKCRSHWYFGVDSKSSRK